MELKILEHSLKIVPYLFILEGNKNILSYIYFNWKLNLYNLKEDNN